MWESDFLKDWHKDLKTVSNFCSGKNKASLEQVLELPEKWKQHPSLFSDFEQYIPHLRYAETKSRNKKAFKLIAKAVVGITLGFVLFYSYGYLKRMPAEPYTYEGSFDKKYWQHYILGYYYKEKGRYDDALKEFKKSRETND